MIMTEEKIIEAYRNYLTDENSIICLDNSQGDFIENVKKAIRHVSAVIVLVATNSDKLTCYGQDTILKNLTKAVKDSKVRNVGGYYWQGKIALGELFQIIREQSSSPILQYRTYARDIRKTIFNLEQIRVKELLVQSDDSQTSVFWGSHGRSKLLQKKFGKSKSKLIFFEGQWLWSIQGVKIQEITLLEPLKTGK